MVPHPVWFLSTWIAGGALAFAGRWPTRSWRRCGRARAASTSTCARPIGPLAGFMTGWTSFVAGFHRRDGRERDLSDIRARPLHSGRGRFDAVLRHSASVRAADVLAPDAAGDARDLAVRVGAHPRRRPGPRRGERAGDAEGLGAAGVHRAGFCGRRRLEREPPAGGGLGERDELAAGADSGDVHLLGMERRGLHGRGDPRSRTQRAARARCWARAPSSSSTRSLEPAVSLRDAGRRACGGEGQRARRHRRAPARRARRRHHGRRRHRQPGGGHQRDGRSRARACTTRWRATACSSLPRRTCIRASGRRPWRSSPRRCGRACSF